MNRFESLARRAAVGAVAVGAFAAAGTGVASAATAPTHRTARAAVVTSAAKAPGAKVGGIDTWEKYLFNNNSSSVLVYEKQTGSVQAPGIGVGSVWKPGQQVEFDAASCSSTDCYGDIYFEAYSTSGVDLGTLDVHLDGSYGDGNMSLDGVPQDQSASQFVAEQPYQPGRGNQAWYFQDYGSTGRTNEIKDNANTTVTVNQATKLPAGLTMSDLVESACNGAGASNCSYTGDTTAGYSAYQVIAEQFDQGGGPDTQGDGTTGCTNPTPDPNPLETQSGWSNSVTNTWGVSGTAGVEIDDLVDASVTASFDQAVTHENNFATISSAALYVGCTSEILGSYPTFTSTGSFTVSLGNTTWDFNDASFTYPRTNEVDVHGVQQGDIVKYKSIALQGDVNVTLAPGVNGPVNPQPR